jgi:hypothetical protein
MTPSVVNEDCILAGCSATLQFLNGASGSASAALNDRGRAIQGCMSYHSGSNLRGA